MNRRLLYALLPLFISLASTAVTLAHYLPANNQHPPNKWGTNRDNHISQTINTAVPYQFTPAPSLTFQANPTLTINLWYGHNQSFGHLGTPQQWINILGNVTGTIPISNLIYSFNGSTPQPLAMGPDTRRLLRTGDFNIELDKNNLNNGFNSLIITATNNLGFQQAETITLTYHSQNIWPLPYHTNWANIDNINQVAQAVDGLWLTHNNGLRLAPQQVGYDRVLAFGDLLWQDFEVTIPITFHGIDESAFGNPVSINPGIGLVLRWPGHSNTPVNCLPTSGLHCGWLPQGANPWYNFSQDGLSDELLLDGNDFREVDPLNRTLNLDVGYYWKIRAQTFPTGTFYGFNLWPITATEPIGWQMSGLDGLDEMRSGSLLFVAHHVDATYGPLTITPIDPYTITLSTIGNGTVVSNPPPPYTFGQSITLTATAAPDWGFTGWRGDINHNHNPLTLVMTSSYAITATFAEIQTHTLTLNTVGQGHITIQPTQPFYQTGQIVTLTATPDPDWLFTGWSGDLNGHNNPVQHLITADSIVTATFALASSLAVSDDFNHCSLNTNIWQYLDPEGDSTLTLNGSQAILSVPANTYHTVWGTGPGDFIDNVPRLSQAVSDTDFDIAVKFESGVNSQYQSQGLLIRQDDNDMLRLEFLNNDNSNTKIFVASMNEGAASAIGGFGTFIATGNTSPLYLRISRNGHSWTVYYSLNGNTWSNFITFNRAMTVTAVDIFVGNDGTPGSEPGHTAIIDYFFNTAIPITPEDNHTLTCHSTITLTTSLLNNTLQLTWNEPATNCLYTIHRSTAPYSGFTIWQANLTTLSTTDPQGMGNTYFYYIEANNCDGGETAVSNTAATFPYSLTPGD